MNIAIKLACVLKNLASLSRLNWRSSLLVKTNTPTGLWLRLLELSSQGMTGIAMILLYVSLSFKEV